jgi:hypothetical protein
VAEIHVIHPQTETPIGFIVCPGYLCECPDCSHDRVVAIAQAGRRDRDQPWHALERAA